MTHFNSGYDYALLVQTASDEYMGHMTNQYCMCIQIIWQTEQQ